MASAKQIAWRKKFARMSKAGKFKKGGKKSTYVKDVLAEQKGGKIGGGAKWMDFIGDWKTSSPKKYPAYKKIHVAVSGDKNSYLELKFHTYNKDSTGKYYWHLMSLTGMKDLIRRFKLKKI